MDPDHGSTDLSAIGARLAPLGWTRLGRITGFIAGLSKGAPSPIAEAAAEHPVPLAPDCALPRDDFLPHVSREKRRSERTNAPLSLVLFRPDGAEPLTARHLHGFVETLHGIKRETDVLGHLGDGSIAVLCPDTDGQGLAGFMRKIEKYADRLHFAVTTATYPAVLFDCVADRPRQGPAFEPLLMPEQAARGSSGYPLKRALDVAGAALAVITLSPLMLVVAAAVAATSPGPIIFRQTRLGRGGVPFTFYKFRSMVAGVDDDLHRHFVAKLINGEPVPEPADGDAAGPYKMRSDPRVTRLGRFMRKTSIDELPQLFNVLKGDMSLVGPRPPISYETAHYQSWHLRRILSIKPGMTGLWQVEGRSKVTFNEMVRMDLRYLRNCSLALDVKILLKTAVVVVRCIGGS